MRLDLFLKISRLVKRRTVARELIDNDKVRVNGAVAKPSREVRPGDRIILAFSSRTVELEVLVLPVPGQKRVETETAYRVITEQRSMQPQDVWKENP